jgi:hypothetical protein
MKHTKRIMGMAYATEELRGKLCRNTVILASDKYLSGDQLTDFANWCDENLKGLYYLDEVDDYAMFEFREDMDLSIIRGIKANNVT